jgi:hypothetical protein
MRDEPIDFLGRHAGVRLSQPSAHRLAVAVLVARLVLGGGLVEGVIRLTRT